MSTQSQPPLRVAVVGGSLGGLTAALLLRDAGCEVDVYERSESKLSGFGAGIVVHEATMRYFRKRGRGNGSGLEVAATYFRYVDATGRLVHEEQSPYTFTAWSTLYRNLLGLFGGERYHHGHALTSFDQDADGVTATFANGRVERVDLLVCSDGVLSTARSQLAPDAVPEYAGYVGWRGTVEERRLSAGAAALLRDAITYGITDHSHMLAYPIPSPEGSTGGRLINFVWYRNVPAGQELDELMVDRHGRRRQISLQPGAVQDRHVAGLREAAGTQLPAALGELVAAAESPFVQVIVDLAVDTMVFGRVCLLGDAAFAPRPHAAAGTAKAAENAWKLAEAIVGADGLEQALSAWEPGQLELGRRLVERSRLIGERYQVTSTARPGDPELRFGLCGPGR